MVVNGSLAGPEIHFELRYYFAINELFITNFYCISLSLHFHTYVSFIISGYSYYVNMLVTRLKSDMCLVFLLHN